MDRIDCGFFLIVPKRDLEGMRVIRTYYEEVHRVTDAIRDAAEREWTSRFLRHTCDTLHRAHVTK